MAKRSVVAMPGDGIGQAVLPQARRVLDAVGFDADYVHADIGWEFWIPWILGRFKTHSSLRP